MNWDFSALDTLRLALAELYPRESEQRRVAIASGLREAAIGFEAAADSSWHAILQYAEKQNLVSAILDLAMAEFPANEALARLSRGAPLRLIQGGPLISHGALSAAEKILGQQSTLVPVAFLEAGLAAACSVAQVRLKDGGLGSGFLYDRYFLTNNHVLPDVATAATAKIVFDYQAAADGTVKPIVEHSLEPSAFFRTSKDDDWSAVGVADAVIATWGKLSPATGVAVGDRVNIIQHPGGGPKHLSCVSNLVVFSGGGRVQYLTDTLPGSSGSPVLDIHWRLVALHRSGGWILEPGSGRKNLRNEGVSIDLIAKALAT